MMRLLILLIKRSEYDDDDVADRKVKVMMMMLLRLLIERSKYDDDDDVVREVKILKKLWLIKTVRVLLLLKNED